MTGILIEDVTPQKATKTGREYFSFWVRVLFDGTYVSISGWKYYPDTDTISSPSQMKGEGKFVNTTKMGSEFFNKVAERTRETIRGMK